MAWKELLKKPYLSQRPQLTQGLASHAEERDLELAFKNLRDLEDHCKKLYKEVRRHEECANGLHRLEKKMSSGKLNFLSKIKIVFIFSKVFFPSFF